MTLLMKTTDNRNYTLPLEVHVVQVLSNQGE